MATVSVDTSLHTITGTRKQSIYPFLVLFAYTPFILYMHRSKIGPQGLNLDGLQGYLAYYHADFALYALTTSLLWLVKPFRQWSLLVLTALYYLATFNWISWHTQSKSFFFTDVYRLIQLFVYYPEFILELPQGIKVRAFVLFSLPFFVAVALRTRQVNNLSDQLLFPINILGIITVFGILLLTPWLISGDYVRQNSIAYMISEQLHDRKLGDIAADRESMANHLGHDGSIATAPQPAAPQPTSGNVIVFIIETAPFSQYPSLRELAATLEHPWLKHNSVVFNRHYTTYPGSDRASYSILSGLYPPMQHHNKWKDSMQYGDSLPRALAPHGYTSYLFSTAPLSFYGDDVMYRNLGFDHLLDVEKTKTLRVKTKDGFRWDKDRLYEMDEELIKMVLGMLHEHSSNEQAGPFMASIAPQASHAPFNCPPEHRNNSATCQSEADKIKINARWQFGLIERLIQALDAGGLLDNTTLVITGDHGIRSKHESPSFPNANVLQQSTFHVPLMIASSQLREASLQIDHPTSHVDIAPTVLHLLGIPQTAYFHGRNLFTDSPRTLYFIGTGYLPVSGFLQDSRYYMENRATDLLLSAPTMNFNDRSQTVDNEETRQIVREELLRLEAFLRREYPPAIQPQS